MEEDQHTHVACLPGSSSRKKRANQTLGPPRSLTDCTWRCHRVLLLAWRSYRSNLTRARKNAGPQQVSTETWDPLFVLQGKLKRWSPRSDWGHGKSLYPALQRDSTGELGPCPRPRGYMGAMSEESQFLMPVGPSAFPKGALYQTRGQCRRPGARRSKRLLASEPQGKVGSRYLFGQHWAGRTGTEAGPPCPFVELTKPQELVSPWDWVQPWTVQVPRTETEPCCWVHSGPSDPHQLRVADLWVEHRWLGHRGGLTSSPALCTVLDNHLFSLVGLLWTTGDFLGSPIFASG